MRKAYITPSTSLVVMQHGGHLLKDSNIADYHGPAGARRRCRSRRSHNTYEDEWEDEEE